MMPPSHMRRDYGDVTIPLVLLPREDLGALVSAAQAAGDGGRRLRYRLGPPEPTWRQLVDRAAPLLRRILQAGWGVAGGGAIHARKAHKAVPASANLPHQTHAARKQQLVEARRVWDEEEAS